MWARLRKCLLGPDQMVSSPRYSHNTHTFQVVLQRYSISVRALRAKVAQSWDSMYAISVCCCKPSRVLSLPTFNYEGRPSSMQVLFDEDDICCVRVCHHKQVHSVRGGMSRQISSDESYTFKSASCCVEIICIFYSIPILWVKYLNMTNAQCLWTCFDEKGGQYRASVSVKDAAVLFQTGNLRPGCAISFGFSCCLKLCLFFFLF